jgi:para-nitrobenzyl esterase
MISKRARRASWLLFLMATGPALAAPQATVEAGRVAGLAQGDVETFLGIPFAAPPVGALRWRAPQPARPWRGVRQSTHYGHDCMQTPFPSDAAPLGVAPAEDCLYMNVWRPAGAKPGDRLPVLVWIYGGGSVNGGASPAVYSGEQFARHGVMFVSFNYRVGRFGFFAFPELTRQDPDHGLLANYGYMDALAAMRWVRQNVAAFGGDAGQVTIYGQSAGAATVYMLMTSPLAEGLFQRAILQSGAPFDKPLFKGGEGSAVSIEDAGVNFARRWGIRGTGADSLAKLRALRPEQVADGLHIGTMAEQASTYVGPVRDGTILPDRLLADAFATGTYAQVPLLVGSTAGDNHRLVATSLDEAFASFGTAADRARSAYAQDSQRELQAMVREMGRDRQYREPNRYLARQLSAAGQPVYSYRFNYVVTPMRSEWLDGPLHATDIPFSMDTVRAKYGDQLAPADLAVANMTHHYWVNFVRSGDPNGPGLPEWPRYDAAADLLMDFATDGIPRAVADPRKARLDAWAEAMGRAVSAR